MVAPRCPREPYGEIGTGVPFPPFCSPSPVVVVCAVCVRVCVVLCCSLACLHRLICPLCLHLRPSCRTRRQGSGMRSDAQSASSTHLSLARCCLCLLLSSLFCLGSQVCLFSRHSSPLFLCVRACVRVCVCVCVCLLSLSLPLLGTVTILCSRRRSDWTTILRSSRTSSLRYRERERPVLRVSV